MLVETCMGHKIGLECLDASRNSELCHVRSPAPPLPPQPVISRDYRGDVDMSVINHFLPILLNMEEEGTSSPILIHEKVTFVYIKHNNLYCICLLLSLS